MTLYTDNVNVGNVTTRAVIQSFDLTFTHVDGSTTITTIQPICTYIFGYNDGTDKTTYIGQVQKLSQNSNGSYDLEVKLIYNNNANTIILNTNSIKFAKKAIV